MRVRNTGVIVDYDPTTGKPAWLLLDDEVYAIIPAKRKTTEIGGTSFELWEERGCWYEVGRPDEIGALIAPAHADGSLPTADEVGEIAVLYEDA
jgi:hypothetical protein